MPAMVSSQFHRISCSPLEVLTFLKGLGFPMAYFFGGRHWVERGEIPGSASMPWVSFLLGGIHRFRQKPDLCQSSTGKRSRQKFKAASVTFNNERQRHQIEQKLVDRMCERIRPLFKLKQQGARLFDRGTTIVCVYQ
ncbi:MAG: hypothetical protein E5X80_33090 [Mesorhizobium sp.]|uniref:hypothetical protein n=1 Tax=Mesorhizobium sp. TaxID=1871066 RepID=UPI000FE9AE9F|nr:hypothetical protein [Mesorhizobium sp.]RWI31357.1 MAG: hypothetical protein EOR13_25970 [Mesorhizobium sp.]TIO54293.1 MAG: hypothetical protein E5X78_03545 [Mesorhizobium sp.]TIO56548.1 MAG: hypothetical protein E5X79_30045 [Mesorhizobium sp.]TJV56124.1 MAG: hypothetical protein E5X80_33090 [Mesorhizobium sp.]